MVTTEAGTKISNPWWEGAYDKWLAIQDAPIHTGYYVEDFRKVERGWWSLRGCPAAILNLAGHQGVTEARVLEIPAGQTIPPFRMALEEIIYVAEGQGLATVWAEGHPKVTFEWQKHSLFRIPNNYYYQLSNTRGDQPALTLHTSYLPLAMTTNANPDYFFNNPYVDTRELYAADGSFYSAPARAVRSDRSAGGRDPRRAGTPTSSPTSPSGTTSRPMEEPDASPTAAASSSPIAPSGPASWSCHLAATGQPTGTAPASPSWASRRQRASSSCGLKEGSTSWPPGRKAQCSFPLTIGTTCI